MLRYENNLSKQRGKVLLAAIPLDDRRVLVFCDRHDVASTPESFTALGYDPDFEKVIALTEYAIPDIMSAPPAERENAVMFGICTAVELATYFDARKAERDAAALQDRRDQYERLKKEFRGNLMLRYEKDLTSQNGKVLLANVNAGSIRALVFGGDSRQGAVEDAYVKQSFTVLDITMMPDSEYIVPHKDYTIAHIAELDEHEREAFASAGICTRTELAQHRHEVEMQRAAAIRLHKRELLLQLKQELGEV